MGVKPVEIPKGSGKWYIRVNYQKRRKTHLVGTYEEAVEVANQVRTALKLYGSDALRMLDPADKAEQVMPTLKKYAERWLEEIEHSDLKLSTRKMYRSNLRIHILPALGSLLVSEMDYKRLKGFLLQKSRETYSTGRFRKTRKYKEAPEDRRYSRDSLRIMVMTLRALLGEAVRDGLLQKNPVENLTTYYKKKKKDREVTRSQVYTKDELYAIEDKLKNRTLYGDHYELSLMLSRTGMRIGEARAARESDINWKAGTIHVTRNIPSGTERLEDTTKTEAGGRHVDATPELLAVLKIMVGRRKAENLKSGERPGKELFATRYREFARDWERAQRQAEVKYRSPHSIRHTYASQMLAAGCDIAWLSKQLGHSSPKVTLEIYSHFIPGNKPKGVNAMDRGTLTEKAGEK